MSINLKVSDFAHFGIITCQKQDTIKVVSHLMAENNIGAIFVESQGEIVGVWSQTDIKELDLSTRGLNEICVEEVMSSPVISVLEHDSISTASYLFKHHGIRHLLMLNAENKPIGILSETDMIASKASEVLLETVSIEEVMNAHFYEVNAEDSLLEALQVFRKHHVDALLVNRQVEGRQERGLVSDRDVLQFMGHEDNLAVPIGDLASWPLYTLGSNSTLSEARKYMMEHRFHHIGVVDDSGECVGLLNFGHLTQVLGDVFYHELEQNLNEAINLYKPIVEQTSSLIMIHDGRQLLFVNPACINTFGYSFEEFTQLHLLDLVAPEYHSIVVARIQETAEKGLPHGSLEELMISKTGEKFWIEASNRPIKFKGKDAVLVIAHDIQAFKLEIEQQKIIQTVFERMDEAILVTDAQTRVVFNNIAFETLTGYVSEEIKGRKVNFLNSGYQTKEFYETFWQQLNEQHSWQGEVWNQTKNKGIRPHWLSVSTVLNEQGEVQNYVGIYQDLTQKKQIEDDINRLSYYDALTDLPNLTLFKDRVNNVIKRDGEQARFAVVYFDVARFKVLNDSVGHQIGNQVLYQVGHQIDHVLVHQDIVARMSADTFLIFIDLPSSDEKLEAYVAKLAQKLIEIFQTPIVVEDQSFILDVNMGIALYPQNGQTVDELIVASNEALAVAKELPNSGYQFYTDSLTAASFEHFFLEKGLRYALENDEIVVFYQPQIDLKTQAIIGAESLVRWQHPELGLISPDKFIGIAEETGLILPLGEVVLRQACLQWLAWRAQGMLLPRISVNISPVQLLDKTLVSKLASILMETGMEPSAMEFEITESFLFKNEQEGLQTIQGLVELGCRISMDDFGTGFSSLSYLKKLPLNQVKIDQSFVRHIPEDVGDMAIIEAVINIAEALDIEVIAEGVETAQQMAILTQLSCQQGQGYLMSKPLPAADFEQWVKVWEKNHCA